MDLSFLMDSSKVTPLLVRLYDSHKLYGLAQDKQPLARAELTTVITELLEMNLSPRESELVADVLIEMMRQAEKDLRQALAERLSVLEHVPLRLILQMANDEIGVARPVLKRSPVLSDMDLIYIIKAKAPEYWQAIAARKNLSGQVVDILADTRDFGTATALAENTNIRLTGHAVEVIGDMAKDSEVLARPLLRREEVQAELAGMLYRFVGEELKRFIRENYELDLSILIDTVDDVVLEFAEAEPESQSLPTPAMSRAAERFSEKGLLTTKLMLGTLRRGQFRSFIAQFSRFSGLEAPIVEEMLTQESGQALAIACRALDVSKPDFISIYLLTGKMRHDGLTADLKELSRAVSYYMRVDKDMALKILRNSIPEALKEKSLKGS